HTARIQVFARDDDGVSQQSSQRYYLGYLVYFLLWIQEIGDFRELDVKNHRRFHVEAGALDDGVLIPLLELNDDLDALLLANRPNSKYCRNVDQADATNLHVMTLHLVTAANEHIVAALAGDDEIVGNEAMPALHQVQHTFRLADSALAGKKQSNSKHVRQRSVKRDRRRKLHLQDRLDAPVELGGFQAGAN